MQKNISFSSSIVSIFHEKHHFLYDRGNVLVRIYSGSALVVKITMFMYVEISTLYSRTDYLNLLVFI